MPVVGGGACSCAGRPQGQRRHWLRYQGLPQVDCGRSLVHRVVRVVVLAGVHNALSDIFLRVQQYDVQLRREQASRGHCRTQAGNKSDLLKKRLVLYLFVLYL